MQNPILIKSADLYAPEHVGARDILIAGGKIIAVAPTLEPNIPGLETIDVKGRKVIPGLIDQHIHVTGGGAARNGVMSNGNTCRRISRN